MSTTSDLIARLEQETGQRIDEESSLAMTGLLGAVSRKMGVSPASYQECDDVAAGVAIQSLCQDELDTLLLMALFLGGEE